MRNLSARLGRLEQATAPNKRPVFLVDVPPDLAEEERHQQTDEALEAAGYADTDPILILSYIAPYDRNRVQVHGPKWWQE